MIFTKVVIVHKLPHRMRLQLYSNNFHIQEISRFILKNKNIKTFDYSPLTKRALVTFNPTAIDYQDVISRLVLALAMEEKCGIVKVHDHTHETKICNLLFSVLAVIVTKSVNVNKGSLNKTFYFGAIFSLIHAVLNHIIKEGNSTSLYRVMTLKNPDTNEEYYHIEIQKGGQITYMLSNLMGEGDRYSQSYDRQIAYER